MEPNETLAKDKVLNKIFIVILNKYGRDSFLRPKPKQLTVFNRCMLFDQSNISTHVDDLSNLLLNSKECDKKKAVILIVDNGPDWSPPFSFKFILLW
jgi:hypothetical protein